MKTCMYRIVCEMLIFFLNKYTTYIAEKYIIYLYELKKQVEKLALGEPFYPVSQRVHINLIFNYNVRIYLCLT